MPLDGLPMLEERVARLRRRAERLGLSPPELIDRGKRRNQDGGEECLVELRGSAPRLVGWRIIAELHHDAGGTRVEVVPGEEVPAGDWQEASARCDHCGLRRRRRTTVLLRHSSGDVAEVGTACLEDFTGQRDPPPEPTLQEFLAAVAAEACERGFMAKAEASDPGEATAERAARRLAGGRDVGEADRGLAGAVEHWVLHELANWSEQSPYEARLVSVFGAPSGSESATARWSPRVGWPTSERDAASKWARSAGWSRSRRASGRSGGRSATRAGAPVFWHALRDERGRDLSWFAVGRRLEEGARYRLRGRVRRYERFRGRAVTVLDAVAFATSEKASRDRRAVVSE